MNKESTVLEVVLIHNNNSERINAMRLVLNSLRVCAPAGIRIRFANDVFWQPEILNSLFLDRVRWALANARTQSLFSRAKLKGAPLASMRSIITGTVSFFVYFIHEIRGAAGKRAFSSRHRQLSRKHAVAWDQFFTSSSSDWLLVLEDDALLTQAGPDGLWKILQDAARWPAKIPSFLLLSEGLGLETLKLKDDDFDTISCLLKAPRFPFTNTSAAYLLNRPLAKLFLESLRQKPALAYNTIDFLISNLMLRPFFEAETPEIYCRHALSPPFENASINGRYSSTISG